MTEVVLEAVSAFRRGAYVLAESLFGECQKKYGSKFFSPNVSVVKNRIIRKFVSGDVPPSLDPMVYYCIPVMNRLEDIQTTLRHNLSVLDCFSNVKIIINLFDKSDESFNWISENFESEIASKVLEVNRLKPLAFWHFSWAKNSFKQYIGDDGVYSSLDGDNYITKDEVARTKQIYAEFGPAVVHHFTGSWGDGRDRKSTRLN